MDIKNAIHWWLSENLKNEKELFGQIRSLLEHFFKLADSLYLILKTQPLPTGKYKPLNMITVGGVTIINQLPPSDFFRLRGMLALIGDMVLIIKHLRKFSDNLDNNTLTILLDSHLPNMMKYRDARNYFAHFDERIGINRLEHGVNGEFDIQELGIKYKKETKGGFYLAFCGDKIFFHDKQKYEKKSSPKSISFNKKDMSGIFSLVKELYDLLTSHRIHKTNYSPSKLRYNLN
ncbi:MAG: hypothetical protein ACTSPY_18500 [Candidatus Helarchaeota archaeon]